MLLQSTDTVSFLGGRCLHHLPRRVKQGARVAAVVAAAAAAVVVVAVVVLLLLPRRPNQLICYH